MPGVYQLSVDQAVAETAAAAGDGVRSVLLFGLPHDEDKDEIGSPADDPGAPVQAAIRAIKDETPNVLVVTDVCLCEYTTHGHCGIVDGEVIVNDATVDRARPHGRLARGSGGRRGRPLRHDGRAGRRDPRGARRRALRGRRDHELRRQVLLGLLRSVPRRGRLGPRSATGGPTRWIRPTWRRPWRGGARSGGGRRHRHGEAGTPLSGRHRAGQGGVRLPDGGLPRQRRVRHAESGRPQRLAGRGAGRCAKC